jgi:hypothetical protein
MTPPAVELGALSHSLARPAHAGGGSHRRVKTEERGRLRAAVAAVAGGWLGRPVRQNGYARSGWPGCVRASRSRWVRRMLHHSLCSAIGIPHSTQMRTRWRGSVLREKSLFRIDMGSPG